MKPENAVKIKYGIWGLIVGSIIAMIIGFAWGGWTTSSTTQKMSEEAVLTSRAAICVAQFMKDPNYEERLKECLSEYMIPPEATQVSPLCIILKPKTSNCV